MICDFCNEREAFVFIDMQGPVARKKLNLCRECAAKLGVTQDPKSISSLFKELSTISQKALENDNKACPVCGTKLSFIRKNSSAGCPECYSIFKDEIRSIISKKGGSGTYTGSMPKRLATFRSVLTDRIVLQTKLEESLKREDYEKAAIYRDYLKALEKSPVNGNDDE
jgi:protein arginine kinase activator